MLLAIKNPFCNRFEPSTSRCYFRIVPTKNANRRGSREKSAGPKTKKKNRKH